VIAIKPWSPDAPYLKKMAAAKTADDAYAVYLAERKAWLETPAYYFDCAEALHRRGANDLAVRVLTGIADLRLEDAALLRIVAHRLAQWGHTPEAIQIFEQGAHLRPEEPQSFRDLALALADRGDALAQVDPAQAITHYNRALQLLNKVATTSWNRFEGISDIALTEANRVVARARRLPREANPKLVVPLDSRLVRNIESDLRIVMTWDSDNTDMDLHVIEPSGEECFYSHNRTAIGGRLSDDFTGGYGPEEYFVRRNQGGTYRIRTNYFGSREQKITGGTTVQATVFTDWGRPTEKRQSLSLRLTRDRETVTIGEVNVAKK
jgi:tetratricopeptide (TPR) repeat protein